MQTKPDPTLAMIESLFAPALARPLSAADAPGRERLLKQAIAERFASLPPIARDRRRASPVTAEELRLAREVSQFRNPLNDGSSLAGGLPYDWYFTGVGTDATFFCNPRIDFAETLARAHRHTGDRVFLDALHALVMDYVSRYWVESTALPAGDNWLCTSCRAGTWHCDRFEGLHAVLRDPVMLAPFSFDDLIAMFRAIDNMMTGLIPNLALGSNWRVHELTNIFTQGYCLPFLKNAAGWLELAVNGLNEEFAVQFHDDGSHEELCFHYGAGTWLVFTWYATLSAQVPHIGLSFDGAKMERCLEYFLSACKPFGLQAAIGDDYACRSVAMLDGSSPPHRADAAPIWDRMVKQGAEVLAQGGDYPAARFILSGGAAPSWTSRHHPDSGYMFMRDGWRPDSLYASINTGWYANCHCHYGLLGIELAGYGREFVVDPGCSALDDRPANANMQRTRAHSTMCVDGLDQQVAVPAQASRLVTGERYDFVVGVYKGGYTEGNAYGPGTTSAGRFDRAFSGTHFRHLLFVKDSYWVVFDAMTTRPGHTAETRFQFLPNAMTPVPGGGYATGWSESNCALLPLHWEGWESQLLQGRLDPIEGWMPMPGGELIPAPVYKATHPTGHGPAWHGSLIFPYRQAAMPRIAITPIPIAAGFGYRIETDAWTDWLFCSNSWSPAEVELDGIRTNSPFWHLRKQGARVIQGFACEGTGMSVGGETIFRAPGTMLAREFDCREGVRITTSQPRVQH